MEILLTLVSGLYAASRPRVLFRSLISWNNIILIYLAKSGWPAGIHQFARPVWNSCRPYWWVKLESIPLYVGVRLRIALKDERTVFVVETAVFVNNRIKSMIQEHYFVIGSELFRSKQSF